MHAHGTFCFPAANHLYNQKTIGMILMAVTIIKI